jgi:hypothetical protein
MRISPKVVLGICRRFLGADVGTREASLIRRDWRNHRMDADRRDVSFLLPFEDWLAIWVNSGHLLERGCRRGQYVMARVGDVGAYVAGNVRIALVEENHAEHWGRPDAREEQSVRLLGNTFSLGRKASVSERIAMSVRRQGNQYAAGRVWVTNGVGNTTVLPNEVDAYLEVGWWVGVTRPPTPRRKNGQFGS